MFRPFSALLVATSCVFFLTSPALAQQASELGQEPLQRQRVGSLMPLDPDVVQVIPLQLDWGTQQPGAQIRQEIEVVKTDPVADFRLLTVSTTNPAIEILNAEETTSGERHVINVDFQIAEDAPRGPLEAAVQAQVRLDNQLAAVRVPIQVNILGEVHYTPSTISRIEYPVQPGSELGQIIIRANPGIPVPNVLQVEADAPFTASVQDAGAGERYVTVAIAQNAPEGPHAGKVAIVTDSRDLPYIEVPVFARVGESVGWQPKPAVIGDEDSLRIQVSDPQAQAFRVTGVRVEPSGLQSSVTIAESSQGAPAVVSVQRGANTQPGVYELQVQTNRPDAEEIRIPVVVQPSR